MSLEVRPQRRLLDLADPLVEGVEGAELLHQLDRGLLAHPGHARDVVAGVAHQGEHVADVLRAHSPQLAHLRGVHPLELLAGPRREHAHAFAHHLEHVLVARDQHRLDPLAGRAPRQRGHHVVGLRPRDLDDREPQRLRQRLHRGELREQ